MRQVSSLIRQAAPTSAPVSIRGESGTGKGLVAREIHSRCARRAGPFVAIDSAALPETLVENELFGHEKGSLRALWSVRPGASNRLTEAMFLDEIGEMPMRTQAKLLRVLEDPRVRRWSRLGKIGSGFRLLTSVS